MRFLEQASGFLLRDALISHLPQSKVQAYWLLGFAPIVYGSNFLQP